MNMQSWLPLFGVLVSRLCLTAPIGVKAQSWFNHFSMTKKDILFLSLPSVLLVVVAGTLFFYANDFFADPNYDLKTERRIDEFASKVQSGELGRAPDDLVKMVGDSWRREDALLEAMAKTHARMSKAAACAILVSITLQLFAVFRVKVNLTNKPLHA